MADGVRGTQGYAEEADDLFVRYESFAFETVHERVMPFYPRPPAHVLDIGAGTGRDAGWFDKAGYGVTAVEPCDVMRVRAMKLHPSPRIKWLGDSLPDLNLLKDRAESFDLVQLSAVFMHLDADERQVAFPVLAGLVKPGGRLVLLVRHGPVPAGRCMFEVPVDEMLALGAASGLGCLHQVKSDSAGEANRRAGVTWMNYVFEKPL